MAEEWLVDGYNLLHARPSEKAAKSKKGREELLAELADFTAVQGRPMRVVLDGKGDPAELDIHRTTLLHVVYSQTVSADACIERLLYELKAQIHFTVVTNDRAIAQLARGSGAAVMGCGDFLDRLKESKKDRSDTLHRDKLRSHGFNRPFEDKLKDK